MKAHRCKIAVEAPESRVQRLPMAAQFFREVRSRKLCLVTSIAVLFFSAGALAECGSDHIHIEATSDEKVEACRALEDVKRYFKTIGVTFTPSINIKISDRVFMTFYTADHAGSPVQLQVSGYFDPARSLIEVTSAFSPHMTLRTPWGIRWSAEIAYSILRHEISHAAVHQLLGGRASRVSKSWMEFIAYAIQIELLDEDLRGRILANYPDAAPFETVERVNPLIYGYDPDAFGVRAFLFAHERGGAQFIQKLLAGESGIDLQDIFWMR